MTWPQVLDERTGGNEEEPDSEAPQPQTNEDCK
jgi:hypothetical protein